MEIFKNNWRRVTAVLVILTLLFYSAIFFNIENKKPTETKSNVEISAPAEIYLDISGAVNKPGFYKLSDGDRVVDLVKLAEGFAKSANRAFITQKLNLAEKLKDGEKIYIPYIFDEQLEAKFTSESVVCASLNSSSAIISKQSSSALNIPFQEKGSEKVNVNSANKDELLGLYGIGEVFASKIIQGRPYKTMDDFYQKIKLTSKTKTALESVLSTE